MLRKLVWIQEEVRQVCGKKSTEHHQKGYRHGSWLRKSLKHKLEGHPGEASYTVALLMKIQGSSAKLCFCTAMSLAALLASARPLVLHLCLTLVLACLLLCCPPAFGQCCQADGTPELGPNSRVLCCVGVFFTYFSAGFIPEASLKCGSTDNGAR